MQQVNEPYYMGRFSKRFSNKTNAIYHRQTSSCQIERQSIPESNSQFSQSINPQQYSQSFVLNYNNISNQKAIKSNNLRQDVLSPVMKNKIIQTKISETQKIVKNQIINPTHQKNQKIYLTPYQKILTEKQHTRKIVADRANKANPNSFCISHPKNSNYLSRYHPIQKSNSSLTNFYQLNIVLRQSHKSKLALSNHQQIINTKSKLSNHQNIMNSKLFVNQGSFEEQLKVRSLTKKVSQKYTPQLKLNNQSKVAFEQSEIQKMSNGNDLQGRSEFLYKFTKNNINVALNNLVDVEKKLRKSQNFDENIDKFKLNRPKNYSVIDQSKKRPKTGINKYHQISLFSYNNCQKQLSKFLKSKSICLNPQTPSPHRPNSTFGQINNKFKSYFHHKKLNISQNSPVHYQSGPKPWLDSNPNRNVQQ